MNNADIDRADRGLSLGKLGNLEVLLARSADEIGLAQRLRYAIFYEEMSATPDAHTAETGRDDDVFDQICDHLIVIDHDVDTGDGPEIVATSRLLRQEMADRGSGFYSSAEFDIEGMVARNPGRRFLELGRSCVRKAYRGKRTVELMWHGIWRYVRLFDVDVMVGCGSLEGTDLTENGPLLAMLRSVSPAPDQWRVHAQVGKGVKLNSLESNPMSRPRSDSPAAPADQGLSAPRRLCLRGCIRRSSVRHDRRVSCPAARSDRFPLHPVLWSRGQPLRREGVICKVVGPRRCIAQGDDQCATDEQRRQSAGCSGGSVLSAVAAASGLGARCFFTTETKAGRNTRSPIA